MKKIFSVLLVLGVVVAMAACGNKKAEEEAEAQRIADSIEQVRVQDSITQAEALIAEQQRVADSIEQVRINDSIAAATAKTPAKKTTVQKVKEAAQAVKEEPATKKLRGGGTSK